MLPLPLDKTGKADGAEPPPDPQPTEAKTSDEATAPAKRSGAAKREVVVFIVNSFEPLPFGCGGERGSNSI